MGTVNRAVPHAELEKTGLEWGRLINGKSPTAQRMLKYSFNLIDDGLVGQQLFAGETTRLAYMTDEAQEGRDQFLEKRDPDWSPYPWYYCDVKSPPSLPVRPVLRAGGPEGRSFHDRERCQAYDFTTCGPVRQLPLKHLARSSHTEGLVEGGTVARAQRRPFEVGGAARGRPRHRDHVYTDVTSTGCVARRLAVHTTSA